MTTVSRQGGFFVVLVAVVVLLSAPGWQPAASAEAGRVVRKSYQGFRGIAQGTTTVAASLPGSSSITFGARDRERFVSVSVTDDVGGAVRALISADLDGDAHLDDVTYICGTSKLIRIPRRAVVAVDLFAGTCADGEPSVVTKGTIEATFFTSG